MAATLTKSNAFLDAFDRFENNGGDRPDWLAPIRKAAIARFAEMGFPERTDEEWRTTDISQIVGTSFVHADEDVRVRLSALRQYLWDDGAAHRIVFVNGSCAPGFTSLGQMPNGVVVTNLAEAFQATGGPAEGHLARYADYQTNPFAALNTAFIRDGALVYVPRGCEVDRPIHILHLTVPGAEPLAVHPRCLIVAEDNAKVTVAETFATLGDGLNLTNPVVELVAAPGANVDHYKVVHESVETQHVGVVQLRQDRDSNVRSHCMTFGGGLVRNNINTVLAGPGADCHLNGLFVTSGTQHVDNHLRVEHAAPHCDSRETFQGILDDQSSGEFVGRIFVHEGAIKTDGKQTNNNLLLSEEAQVNTKPQLEIFCDDVKCTHGATIGQIDSEALFYLRSRGLNERDARNLLVEAFAGVSLGHIAIEPLKARLNQVLQTRLTSHRAGGEQV